MPYFSSLIKTLDVATRAGADIEERLTLVEASVRVLPAVDPARGSVLLMGLLSPLMHVVAQGLQSTTPDEPAVRWEEGERDGAAAGGPRPRDACVFLSLMNTRERGEEGKRSSAGQVFVGCTGKCRKTM